KLASLAAPMNRQPARLLPHLERLHQVNHAHFFEPPLNHAGAHRTSLQLFELHAINHFLRAPDQVPHKKRLGDEFLHTLDEWAKLFFDVGAAGEENERNLLGLLARAELVVELPPIKPRHAIVAKD